MSDQVPQTLGWNHMFSLTLLCPPQTDNPLASMFAHPLLTAPGLPSRDWRFLPQSTTASAAASVLALLSASQPSPASRSRSASTLLPSGRRHSPPQHDGSTMYHSDRTVVDR